LHKRLGGPQSRSGGGEEKNSQFLSGLELPISHRILGLKLKGKKPFERPRRRWEDNMGTDFKDIECMWTEFI
jgi:hypothetical protein